MILRSAEVEGALLEPLLGLVQLLLHTAALAGQLVVAGLQQAALDTRHRTHVRHVSVHVWRGRGRRHHAALQRLHPPQQPPHVPGEVW